MAKAEVDLIMSDFAHVTRLTAVLHCGRLFLP